jgi:hypothetical protein
LESELYPFGLLLLRIGGHVPLLLLLTASLATLLESAL